MGNSHASTDPNHVRKELANKDREEMAKILFEAFDDDQSKTIDMWEFIDQYRKYARDAKCDWMEVFKLYDTNNDNMIDVKEFVTFIVESNKHYSEEEFIERMISAIVGFRKIEASPTDSHHIWRQMKKKTRKEMVEMIWEAIDDDCNGYCDHKEFVLHVGAFTKHKSPETLFKVYDSDKNGKISKEEFFTKFLNENNAVADDLFLSKCAKVCAKFRQIHVKDTVHDVHVLDASVKVKTQPETKTQKINRKTKQLC
uniref:EF-hand domain-containing protein n=1 Tax=Lotharella globosa TaxID=91324 RepID=A0A7S3Z915_9EUKA